MAWNAAFYLNSVLFGAGLAADAFSVSLANGLQEPFMKIRRMSLIAGTFSLFQFLMPMLGWVCVHTILALFESVQRFIPWIALILLLFIGGKMLLEGVRSKQNEAAAPSATRLSTLLLQGVATSIDALSVGFTIADYTWQAALAESLIIGAVTFLICFAGLEIGKRFGTRLAGKASVLGGLLLIGIGIEIFINGIR